MTGHFDVLTDMFITKCVPVLDNDIIKQKNLFGSDPTRFCMTHKSTLKICEVDANCVGILGYEKDELINKKNLYDLIGVKNFELLKESHKSSKNRLHFTLKYYK
jgi:hypothetical protein